MKFNPKDYKFAYDQALSYTAIRTLLETPVISDSVHMVNPHNITHSSLKQECVM